MSRHQVARAYFNLRCDSVPDGELRQRWERDFTDRYAPLIAQALDEYEQSLDDPLATVQIDRLELDFGVLSNQSWDDDSLLQQLRVQIAAQLKDSAQRRDPDSWRLHSYLHFLKWGSWPPGSAFQRVDEAVLWLQRTSNILPRFLAELRSVLTIIPFWQRLAWQHDLTSLSRLTEAVANQLHRPVPDWPIPSSGLSKAESLVIQLWLLCLDMKGPGSGTNDLSVQNIAEELNNLNDSADTMARALNLLRSRLQRSAAEVDLAQSGLDEKPASVTDETPLSVKLAGCSVAHAGLILLHPFLADLFRHCGWLEGKEFHSQEARLAALFALHYAASGKREADEGELILCKWLVNCPSARPVPRCSPLEQSHYEEIDACLQALINHWSALKNTSIAGLREAFLQRSGSLQPQDEGMRLCVERSTLDILLARLPWSLSLVQLPWQPQTLFVEWG